MFGVIALSAVTTLIIGALALVIPAWLAAIIVAVVAGIIASILGSKAKRALQGVGTPPEETVQTLKEDLEWAKSQRTSVARSLQPARK